MARNLKLSRMITRTDDVVREWSHLHFAAFQDLSASSPAINLYRYDNRLEVWIEMPGADQDRVRIELLPGRLKVSGERCSPLPAQEAACRCREVLAMEIEGGRFSREIPLPEIPLAREKVAASLENGLLRVILPFDDSRCG